MLKLLYKFLALMSAMTMFIVLTPLTASAAVPGQTTGLTSASGDKQVVLAWTAVTSNPAVTDYFIEYSSDAGVTYTRFFDAVSNSTTATVTGLTNDKIYYFRVSAKNNDGTGPVSTAVTATPFVIHTPASGARYSACPTALIPSAGFTDTTSADVDCIKYYGITKGTTDTTYSPYDTVSRWQMALFLTRMVEKTGTALPAGSAQGFLDISNYSTEIQTAINQLKQLGITIGKTSTTYAPADPVTREEMALFITRLLKKAKAGPGANLQYVSGTTGPKEIKSNDTDTNFTDISYWGITMDIRNAIVNLWNLGVTDVQDVTKYEPTLNMTRKSMATFMARALAHTNARPKGLVLQPSTYRAKGSPQVYFSVTHRDDNFLPVSGTTVDTFRWTHSVVATVVRFDSNGNCSLFSAGGPSNTAQATGSMRCAVDSLDPKTDVNGNLSEFWEVMPTANKVDVWAWTAALNSHYDNDVHATAASKVTVETYP